MKGEVPEGDEGIPAGQGRHQARGDGRDNRRDLAHGASIAGGGRRCWPTKGSRPKSSIRARFRRWTRTRSSNRSRKTHRLVVVDEDNPRCSVATDIAAMVADKGFDFLDAPIKIVTAPHTPVPFSPPLEQVYMPTSGADRRNVVRRAASRPNREERTWPP